MDIRTILLAVYRSRWFFATCLVALTAAGLAGVNAIPASYVSDANIAIERPDNTVADGDAGDRDRFYQRFAAIRHTVLARGNLFELAVRHGLADSDASPQTRDRTVASIRDRITIEVDNESVVNQYTGKLGLLPLGIRVAFECATAACAKDVASDLTDQVLQTSRQRDRASLRHRNAFLDRRLAESGRRLAEIDQRIGSFKATNSKALPELYAVTVRRLQDLDSEIARTRESVTALGGDAEIVAAELATSSPDALLFADDGTRIAGPDERLNRLEIAYASARARYSPEHPELVRLQREIDSLRPFSTAVDSADLERRLDDLQTERSAVLERYAVSHPDVEQLSREIESVETALEQAQSRKPAPNSIASNPAYNRLLVKRQAVEDNRAREERRLASLLDERDDLEVRLESIPEVERELELLLRERSREQRTYDTVEATLSSAEVDAGLRTANLLDNFRLVEAPTLPSSPASPDRRLMAILVLMVATTVSLLASLVFYRWRDKIWSPDEIRSVVDADIVEIPAFR